MITIKKIQPKKTTFLINSETKTNSLKSIIICATHLDDNFSNYEKNLLQVV